MQIHQFFVLLLLANLLISCATHPSADNSSDNGLQYAEQLLQDKKYLKAAQQFTTLAQQLTSPKYEEILLRAVSAFAQGEQLAHARQVLLSVQTNDRFPKLAFYLTLSRAHLAMAERQVDQVLMLLQTSNLDIADHYFAEFHLLRARAYSMSGNRLETATELVKREKYIHSQHDIASNQRAIWKSLSRLSERALQQLRVAPPPDILSGWMQLVQIAKQYQLHPAMLKEQIQLWRNSYQNHPVTDRLLSGLLQRKAEDVRYPEHIALLLPLNGKFSRAAEALRDGFMAAYYQFPSSDKLTVRIYNVADNAENILQYYKYAQRNGAQFIVGPLNKIAVNILANEESIEIPTLALNYAQVTDSSPPNNFYQFGLSPEEEAIQIAERTWLDGHVTAATLVPTGSWGIRVFQAFKQRWEQLGGKIVEYQAYNAALNDFSIPIKMLLNIDESQQRYRNIKATIKKNIKYTPRRRKDIDFIFLAAYPRQARQIRPQLKFYHATKIPIYATSHIFTGTLHPEMDRDMDGIIFGDMPWVLTENSTNKSIRGEIERYISKPGKRLQRLYALGIDAFNIIAALNPLKNYAYERYDGETGSLSLDEHNRINRQLTWVKFRSGRPVLLDKDLQ